MKKLVQILTIFSAFSCVFALEQNYFLAKNKEIPGRELAIIATDTGFYPEKSVVFVGEMVHFFLTSSTSRPTCLILKEKEFYREIKKGKVTEGEVYFDRPGVYEYYCPAGAQKGKIVVLEHPKTKSERIKRELASKARKKVKIWRPKDE